jgi:hypothetical protein
MYLVKWRRTAQDRVTNAWLDGDSTLRAAITAAVAEVDKQLADERADKGESRAAGRRVLFVSPLGVNFRVNSHA